MLLTAKSYSNFYYFLYNSYRNLSMFNNINYISKSDTNPKQDMSSYTPQAQSNISIAVAYQCNYNFTFSLLFFTHISLNCTTKAEQFNDEI